MPLVSIVVVEETPSNRQQADRLSAKLGLPVITQAAVSKNQSRRAISTSSVIPVERSDLLQRPYSILVTDKGLMLENNLTKQRPLFIDFSNKSSYSRRLQAGGVNQLLAKAIGIRQGLRPDVLDCTAGLARDAYFLAAMGCRVKMLERSRVLATLIEDALLRSGRSETEEFDTGNGGEMLDRLSLEVVDARNYLKEMPKQPPVVYIDTMFPQRKKTALVKGDMQMLKGLLQQEDDAESLLKIALDRGYTRVVVKRPVNWQWPDSLEAHHIIPGKSVRFDVFM